LQEAFEKLPNEPVVPVKYMRSQAPKPGQAAPGQVAVAGMCFCFFVFLFSKMAHYIHQYSFAAPEPVDPYDLMDAVNILKEIKDDWFENLVRNALVPYHITNPHLSRLPLNG
jgi:hypothetical protein